MCAKVKAITPARRSTQQQQQQSRRSGRPSNNGDGDDSEGSENGNDSGSTEPGSNESLDFLTAGPSQRNTQHQTRQDNTADDPSADESEVSNEPEISMPPPRPQVARRSAPPGSAKKTKAPRKQTQPKKRKDHVLREIVTMQHSVAHLIPRAPFYRLVRETVQRFQPDFKLTKGAVESLQDASEHYLTQLFEDSYLCAIHRSRVTLNDKDIQLALSLRGTDPGKPY